jgi:hypothetical protein
VGWAVLASGLPHVAGRLPAAVSAFLGLVTLAAVAIDEVWAVVRGIGVIAHEGAHAITGSCLGGRVTSVRLNRGGTGDTDALTRAGTGVAFLFTGYLGPSTFGVVAAALIARGLIVAVLWTGVVLLAVLLPSIRNWFGAALVIGTGFALFTVASSGQPWLESLTAYGLTWLLLLSGVRGVLEHGTGAKDAHKLRDMTRLPRGLWRALWLAGSLAALVFGASLLV